MNDQLDLFLDSQSVRFVNEVIAALAARDAQRAAAGLGALRAHAPADANLPALESLSDALARWRPPVAQTQAIAAAARWLESELVPAAQRAMGVAAGRFVAAFFRDLADAARGLPYSQAEPTAHRAWLCLRCGAWAEAEAAAHAIPRASTTPDALHWLACARYRQHGLAAARSTLFALAWHAPQRLASALAEVNDELLDRDWQRFVGACEWDGMPDAELPAWFPAWYLLEHPVVGNELDYFDAPNTNAVEAARLLKSILVLESRGDWHKLASARDKLHKLNADLFKLYMGRRAVRYL
jgi:hypothetical protein